MWQPPTEMIVDILIDKIKELVAKEPAYYRSFARYAMLTEGCELKDLSFIKGGTDFKFVTEDDHTFYVGGEEEVQVSRSKEVAALVDAVNVLIYGEKKYRYGDALEIEQITRVSPFQIMVCPVCGNKKWVSIRHTSVFCGECNAKLELRYTAGDPGFVADLYPEHCCDVRHQGGTVVKYRELAQTKFPNKYAYLIYKEGDYKTGWLYKTAEGHFKECGMPEVIPIELPKPKVAEV